MYALSCKNVLEFFLEMYPGNQSGWIYRHRVNGTEMACWLKERVVDTADDCTLIVCVAASNVVMPRRPATAMDHVIKENVVQPPVIRPKLTTAAAGTSDQVSRAAVSYCRLMFSNCDTTYNTNRKSYFACQLVTLDCCCYRCKCLSCLVSC